MHFPQTSVSPSALQAAPPYYLGRGENQKNPTLELPLQLLLLLLVRLRELGLLLALFALLRKETNNNVKFSNQIPVTKN